MPKNNWCFGIKSKAECPRIIDALEQDQNQNACFWKPCLNALILARKHTWAQRWCRPWSWSRTRLLAAPSEEIIITIITITIIIIILIPLISSHPILAGWLSKITINIVIFPSSIIICKGILLPDLGGWTTGWKGRRRVGQTSATSLRPRSRFDRTCRWGIYCDDGVSDRWSWL